LWQLLPSGYNKANPPHHMTKILFLDESGDHNLTKIDQTHPIFVLGGVIADKKYAEGEMSEKVFNFKKRVYSNY
jgi:hypothetical protein